MKALTQYLVILFLLGSVLSCGSNDDGPPNAQELAFERLAGTWDLSNGGSIVVDGQDASLNFPGFSLSFTDGGYNTTNAGELFNATGTWSWADEAARMISLDDGKQVTIVNLTEESFVFSFEFDGGGQANLIDSTSGSYTISVNK